MAVKKKSARMALFKFRVSMNMTQEEFAAAINYSRSQYALVENGYRDAKQSFWEAIQRKFNVSDAEMFALMKRG